MSYVKCHIACVTCKKKSDKVLKHIGGGSGGYMTIHITQYDAVCRTEQATSGLLTICKLLVLLLVLSNRMNFFLYILIYHKTLSLIGPALKTQVLYCSF